MFAAEIENVVVEQTVLSIENKPHVKNKYLFLYRIYRCQEFLQSKEYRMLP
jgi:hypothetical protein